MKKVLLFLFFCLSPLLLSAQNATLTIDGTVLDKSDRSPILQATVQLLHLPDSTLSKGGVTNEKGFFSLHAPAGNYVLRISYVGYATYQRTLSLAGRKSNLHLANIELETD